MMEKLYDRYRFPEGLRVIPLLIFIPVGIALGFLRFFIGLQALLASVILQKVSVVRSVMLRGICVTLGLVVREENPAGRKENVAMIVSNHISILDHIAIHLVTGSIGATSQKVPVLFQLAFHCKNLDKGHNLEPGQIVDIQPEGAITNGRHGLLKFRPLSSTLSNEVQPVALRMWRPPLTDVPSNILGATWFGDLLWFLIVPISVITIKYLPPVKQEDEESEEDWTKRVQEKIAEELGVPITEHTAASKADLERRLLPAHVQLRLLGPAQMAVRLKENFPHLSLELIRSEIERTNNIHVAIANLRRIRPESIATGSCSQNRKSDLDTAAAVFPKSAQDRMVSFQERKARLIESARRRYLEKRALNVVSC